jgi:hypothetical protein
MGSLNRVPVTSPAPGDAETIIPLERSGIFTETGSLFKDDTLAGETFPYEDPGTIKENVSLFNDGPRSALRSHVSSQRSGRKAMFLHWLNEESLESTADWLVCLMYEARNDGNARQTQKEFLGTLIKEIETAFYQSAIYRTPKPSAKTQADPIPDAESLPSLSDGSSCAYKKTEENVLDVLVQKLYGSLYFKNAGGYRTCVNNTSGKATAPSKKSTTSQQSGQKRASADSNETSPDGDQDGKSGKIRRAKKGRPNLEEFATAFACPLCKGDIKFGYEGECRDWKSHSIDTVLRVCSASYRSNPKYLLTYGKRHLSRHVEVDHISRDAYSNVQVNELRRTFTFAVDGKPQDLWVAAYMVLFNIPETERHKVPSPCTTTHSSTLIFADY